jgi:hypothetical protein
MLNKSKAPKPQPRNAIQRGTIEVPSRIVEVENASHLPLHVHGLIDFGSPDSVCAQLRKDFGRIDQDPLATAPPAQQKFNSPNQRVRVFLGPFLTRKGERWAVPLRFARTVVKILALKSPNAGEKLRI